MQKINLLILKVHHGVVSGVIHSDLIFRGFLDEMNETWIFENPLALMSYFHKIRLGNPDTILYKTSDLNAWKHREDDSDEGKGSYSYM